MKPLENGQLWKLPESRLEITLVGKLLVHYRVYKGNAKRATQTALLNKVEFEKYLKKSKAVLVAK